MSIEKVLEQHTAQDAKSFEELKADFEELKAEVKASRKDIAAIQQQLGQYKGFFGGVLFVITAVWAFIQFAAGYFK
jgi:hypothetical protein